MRTAYTHAWCQKYIYVRTGRAENYYNTRRVAPDSLLSRSEMHNTITATVLVYTKTAPFVQSSCFDDDAEYYPNACVTIGKVTMYKYIARI